MPLDFVDIKENKAKSRIELEKENSYLKERLDEVDSALFELLIRESGKDV